MAGLLSDIRFAGRRLVRTPIFSCVSGLSLAIGFGLSTTILAVGWNAVVRPLPFPELDRLVTIWEKNERQAIPQSSVSEGNFLDLRDAGHLFSNLIYFTRSLPILKVGEREDEIPAASVSGSLSGITGIRPAMGRGFQPGDFMPQAAPVVLLSDAIWREWFGGRPDVLGGSIRLGGRFVTVIGVMPPGFSFPYPLLADPVKIWAPDKGEPSRIRKFHGLYVVGKLAPGVTADRARRELAKLSRHLQIAYPATNKDWEFSVVELREQVVHDLRHLLALLLTASLLVLMIASANTSIMWLSRDLKNIRLFAAELSLGASRWQAVRGVLAESAVLALAGAIGGVVLSLAARPLIARFMEVRTMGAGPAALQMNWAVAAVITCLCVLVGILAGLAPALFAVNAAMRDPMGRLHGAHTTGRRSFVFHAAMAAFQTALSITLLLAGAALALDYFHARASDFGRRTDEIAVAKIGPPDAKYRLQPQRVAFYSSLLDRIQAVPSVRDAAVVGGGTLTEGMQLNLSLPGAPAGPMHTEQVNYFIVTPHYFRTIGATILKGRDFTGMDGSEESPVAIINESLSRRLWPDQDAVGRQIAIQNTGTGPHTIIGVVKDIDHFVLTRERPEDVYVPFRQRPWIKTWLLVRSSKPGGLPGALQHTIRELEPEASVTSFSTFEQLHENQFLRPRLQLQLLSSFSVLSLALALIGICGVVAYQSAQRTRETAIRMALGASRGQIVSLFARQTAVIAGLGVGGGLFSAAVAARWLRSWMIASSGSVSYPALAGVAVLFTIVIAAASAIPIWRNTRVPAAIIMKEC